MAVHEAFVLHVVGVADFQWGSIYLRKYCEEICQDWGLYELQLSRKSKKSPRDDEP